MTLDKDTPKAPATQPGPVFWKCAGCDGEHDPIAAKIRSDGPVELWHETAAGLCGPLLEPDRKQRKKTRKKRAARPSASKEAKKPARPRRRAPQKRRKPPQKPCEVCGTLFEARKRTDGLWEPRSVFQRRRTCGKACGRKLAMLTRRETERKHPPKPRGPRKGAGAEIPWNRSRNCRECGEPLERKRHPGGRWEGKADYLKRQTCGLSCAVAGRKRRDPRPKPVAPERQAGPGERGCAVCGGVMVRREKERNHAFLKRQTCGPICTRELQARRTRGPTPQKRQQLNLRDCAVCGVRLERRVTEKWSDYARRLTCSRFCARRVVARRGGGMG